MALDEDTNNPASYWNRLAEDQAAGRFWKCQCGESNPGDYDTCHFCQRGNPTPDPVTGVGRVFTPTREDMEECYNGVLVAYLGEDGEAIALTGDKTRALEALDTYYRAVCGQANILDDATANLMDAYYYLDCGYAVFTRRRDGGWEVAASAAMESGAVPVTWFRGAGIGPAPKPYERLGDPQIW
ncbi:hypothetical protein OG571_47490 (plasmid) [Streptomyces sp. NBC_01369]|uniref:hypothetical protein n=1 Tax=Streptomyces sp. NBC_01369 TaxID=2903842 RepID=UPI002F907A1D